MCKVTKSGVQNHNHASFEELRNLRNVHLTYPKTTLLRLMFSGINDTTYFSADSKTSFTTLSAFFFFGPMICWPLKQTEHIFELAEQSELYIYNREWPACSMHEELMFCAQNTWDRSSSYTEHARCKSINWGELSTGIITWISQPKPIAHYPIQGYKQTPWRWS